MWQILHVRFPADLSTLLHTASLQIFVVGLARPHSGPEAKSTIRRTTLLRNFRHRDFGTCASFICDFGWRLRRSLVLSSNRVPKHHFHASLTISVNHDSRKRYCQHNSAGHKRSCSSEIDDPITGPSIPDRRRHDGCRPRLEERCCPKETRHGVGWICKR
jgi:hypothetical protein